MGCLKNHKKFLFIDYFGQHKLSPHTFSQSGYRKDNKTNVHFHCEYCGMYIDIKKMSILKAVKKFNLDLNKLFECIKNTPEMQHWYILFSKAKNEKE